MPKDSPRIHIVGAAGSGTTTLGLAVARELRCAHLDGDDFFWIASDPPYKHVRPADQRVAELKQAIDGLASWVQSGSLWGWGESFLPLFNLVIFLWIPSQVRMKRLIARETVRFGPAALAPGGAMYDEHRQFIEWAAGYDTNDSSSRSRAKHEAWLATMPCPVIRLEGDLSTEYRLQQIRQALER
jgi:adenylate kinase family enzyme